MSEEETPKEEVTPKVETPATPATPAKEGEHPETVSWTQYVGLKEKFNKTETELKTKVETLEGQLKTTVSAENHKKVAEELETTKTKLTEVSTELQTKKDATLTEKRDTLVKKGVAADKVATLSETELDHINAVLGNVKPKPDLGGGTSGDTPEKAKGKIHQGFETLHPTK